MFSKTEVAERWFRVMVDMYCDVQPDIGHLHLPFGRKADVYDKFAA